MTVDAVESAIEAAVAAWIDEHGMWSSASYSTAENGFLQAAETIYCRRAGIPQPPADVVASERSKAKIPDDLRWKVWEADDFRCRSCGARGYLTVDHIVPESRGGATALHNLQTLCRSCNSQKGVR